ncbi:DEAD/DEAH box helicase [Microbacterium sp. JZ101]
MTTATTQPETTFADLGVPAHLIEVLVAEDRPTPFPIQRETLPSTLAGRDVLGRGKTGSGKTLAFAIPLVARLSAAKPKRIAGRPSGLVLAPTRELATQIARVVTPLAKASGLTVAVVFGGVSQKPQEAAFRAGVDIVVACPGRLEDLMSQGIVNLDRVAVTVLDEADHMADLGFLPGVTRILAKTPAGGQRMFFSATLDNGVDKLVARFLKDPVRHSIDPAESPVPAMTHHVFEVDDEDKTELVRTLASGVARRILFTRTKHQAKKLAKQLTARGIPAVDLHGNLSQNARDRNLADFSSGRVRVLVATDVAARGVHVDGVDLVVHVDPPAEHKAYVHRSGRTARAGSAGDVVTVMLPSQRQDTKQLLRKAGIAAQPQRVTPESAAVTALVGEVAPRVAPVPGGPGSGNAPAPSAPGTSQGANARRKRAAREGQGGQQPAERTGGRGGASAGRNGGGGRNGGAARGQGGRGRAQGGSQPMYSTSSGDTAPRTHAAAAESAPSRPPRRRQPRRVSAPAQSTQG